VHQLGKVDLTAAGPWILSARRHDQRFGARANDSMLRSMSSAVSTWLGSISIASEGVRKKLQSILNKSDTVNTGYEQCGRRGAATSREPAQIPASSRELSGVRAG